MKPDESLVMQKEIKSTKIGEMVIYKIWPMEK